MIIRSRKASDIRSSEITPESVYVNRRRFLKEAGIGAAAFALAPGALACETSEQPNAGAAESIGGGPLAAPQEVPARFATMKSELGEELNSY